MSGEPTFSTHDLRSGAVNNKRIQTHKHKWALGEVELRSDTSEVNRAVTSISAVRLENGKELQRLRHRGKVALDRDIVTELYSNQSGDSSADEDVVEPSAAPEPDAEIVYSFDHARGPASGSQVLSLAVTKAVERFENVQTEQLVKAEYELLDSEGEAVARTGRDKGKKVMVKDEDDFELV